MALADLIDRIPVLVPFASYLVAVFVIAVVSHRHLKGAHFETEYYVGGRRFGAWVLAMSWVATLASGGSFLGYPSRIYSYGWSMAFWVSGSVVTAIVGLGIVGKRINRLARQTGALTLVDLLRERFQSRAIGIAYPLVIVFITTVYLWAQFVAGARILENMLGMTYEAGLVLFAISVVAYTTYGGFRAVAWTDTMQGIVMIMGIALLVPFAVHAAGGLSQATLELRTRPDPVARLKGIDPDPQAYLYGPGPQRIPNNIEELLAYEKQPTGPRPRPAGNPGHDPWFPISMGISFFMLRSIAATMMPTTVPRLLAFRDTKALKRAMLLLAPYVFVMYGSSLITMNCAFSLDLGLEPHQSDQAVPALAKQVAPSWLAGIIIAAPFAAVMSTVDSGLLVISSSVVRDLVQRQWAPGLSTAATKWLSYSTTGGAGLLVFLLARTEPPFLQPLVIYYAAGSGCALFWPGLATLFWKRATAFGVVAGSLGGVVVFALCNAVKPFESVLPLHPFCYGFAASALLTALGSLAARPQTDEQLERYFGAEP